MEMSPLHIQFVIACYSSTSPIDYIGKEVWFSEAGVSIRKWMEARELVYADDYMATDKGAFFVEEMLCRTPLPDEVFVDPRENKRKEQN